MNLKHIEIYVENKCLLQYIYIKVLYFLTMAKKSTTKKKETKAKTKKETDINDIDAMFEDMKDLALNKPEVKVKETKEIIAEEPKTEEIIEEETKVEETIIEEETKIDNVEEENVVVVDDVEKETITEEDLEFLDKISNEGIEDEEEKKPVENKKRKTYEEMFGHTWMGYGFSE